MVTFSLQIGNKLYDNISLKGFTQLRTSAKQWNPCFYAKIKCWQGNKSEKFLKNHITATRVVTEKSLSEHPFITQTEQMTMISVSNATNRWQYQYLVWTHVTSSFKTELCSSFLFYYTFLYIISTTVILQW